MFTIGCHNVTDIHKVRITKGLTEGEGFLTLCFHASPDYWSEEQVENEYTFFFKDLEKGYRSLMESLEDAMYNYTKEQSNDG
jgi:hypothetical protein